MIKGTKIFGTLVPTFIGYQDTLQVFIIKNSLSIVELVMIELY